MKTKSHSSRSFKDLRLKDKKIIAFNGHKNPKDTYSSMEASGEIYQSSFLAFTIDGSVIKLF
ncbi:CLUMA_CG008348, isoform A [Clunio marinus]|uniref:CLUMA_CG008348, isoform A n=1 Tax=Clunio marinus TaxID=568069 RepID=A0A1J1I3G9_9DIPT|nr:CLUMA_CG008348, isoform A [Clunio marinus]